MVGLSKKIDIPLFALVSFLLAGTGLLCLGADFYYSRRTKVATLHESSFLTTEWRLLKELKDRTDQLLREKDEEIGDLRARYRSLLEKHSSADLLAAIEAELRQAEAERQAILSTRIKISTSPVSSRDAAPAALPRDAVPRDAGLSELLSRRIRTLEDELAGRQRETERLSKELGDLRKEIAASAEPVLGGAPAVEALPPVPSPAVSPQVSAGGKAASLDEGIALIEREMKGLPELEPLSLADIKTRALLRAIVRTTTIRAEYPGLPDSLDRYFDLYRSEALLKGKREAYASSIEALKSRRQ